MKTILTHSQPDADAFVSAYLAERFLFAGESVAVRFVSRGVSGKVLDSADCVVDIGNEYDSSCLRFDHKPPAFADRNATCATRLVWEHLRIGGENINFSEELVKAVHAGDANPPRRVTSLALIQSRQSGFHAFLRGARKSHTTDNALYDDARDWLNTYAVDLSTSNSGRVWVEQGLEFVGNRS